MFAPNLNKSQGLLGSYGMNPLMALGSGLLSAGGYTTMPVSTGQGLAAGFENMQRQGLLSRQSLLDEEKIKAQRAAAALASEKAKLEAEKYRQERSDREITIGALQDLAASDPTMAQYLRVDPTGKLAQEYFKTKATGGGLFEGTGMTAQAANRYIDSQISAARQANPNMTTAEESAARKKLAADFARWHLMQPRQTGVDAVTGMPLYTQPTPLPGLLGQPARSMPPASAPKPTGAPAPTSAPEPVLTITPQKPAGLLGDNVPSLKVGERLSEAQVEALGLAPGVYVGRQSGNTVTPNKIADVPEDPYKIKPTEVKQLQSEISTLDNGISAMESLINNVREHGTEAFGPTSNVMLGDYGDVLAAIAAMRNLGVLQEGEAARLEKSLPMPDAIFKTGGMVLPAYEAQLKKLKDARLRKYQRLYGDD